MTPDLSYYWKGAREQCEIKRGGKKKVRYSSFFWEKFYRHALEYLQPVHAKRGALFFPLLGKSLNIIEKFERPPLLGKSPNKIEKVEGL